MLCDANALLIGKHNVMTADNASRTTLRAVLVLAGALLLAACAGDDAASSQPVITGPVAWEPRQETVEAVGTARALRSVTLYPESTGEVVAVRFTAGQKVEAGQTLLELDARDEKLAVEAAGVALGDARRLHDRYRRSKHGGAVTGSTLDDARSAVDRARIALDRARVALDRRSIEAPFAGHIGLPDVDPGERIGPDTAVAEINDRSVLLISFELPEILLGKLQVDQPVELSARTDNGRAVTGKIKEIDSRVDRHKRTFVVRAHVDNHDDRLRPGMSFRIKLALEGNRFPAVPETALQWGGEGAYVWKVENGKARRVPATIVQRRRGKILLDADLPSGSAVVVEGVQRLRDGQPVRSAGAPAA